MKTAVGDPRLKQVMAEILKATFEIIEKFDVSPSEFWTGMGYLTEVGQANEIGLLVAGTGIEHFLDLRIDLAERDAGIAGGTPRTIEGPLYIAGAPLSIGETRIDRDPEAGEVLIMSGVVKDEEGQPIRGATVEVWQANTKGGYSFFDPSQSLFNLRGRIEALEDGRYSFRTIMPVGYACPPDGPTQKLLTLIGRHGRRPAHIHFLVTAPGYRSLTTQINIDGDEYLHDDFAFATRDGLIPPITRHSDETAILERGLSEPFSTIAFDFSLNRDKPNAPDAVVVRTHAQAQPEAVGAHSA
jgi:catechol 1,2-dioxygenase